MVGQFGSGEAVVKLVGSMPLKSTLICPSAASSRWRM
jgi:hypothetical protein